MTPSITLLGPQRRPTLDRVLSSLDVDGPVAVVNAGWQEREADDAEILALAGGQAVNLRLFARWMDVLQGDPEYAAAEREHRQVLDELQQLYLIRLDHALQAVYAVTARDRRAPAHAGRWPPPTRSRRCGCSTRRTWPGSRQLHDDFYGTWRLEERGAIAAHRAEVRELLSTARVPGHRRRARRRADQGPAPVPPVAAPAAAGGRVVGRGDGADRRGSCSSTTGRRRAPR